MCGRYLLRNAPEDATHTPWRQYWHDVQITPRFNICPTEQAYTLRFHDGAIHCDDALRWGFKPSWSKFAPSINARAEGLLEGKMFKHSARHKRCLVLADGFYEPKGPSTEKKRPWYLFQFSDKRVFTFAGLWLDQGFTIITTEPNRAIAPVHDRMPLIMEAANWERWLDPSVVDEAEIAQLLQAHEYEGMESYEVSDFVKKPGAEGEPAIAPAKKEINSQDDLF